jgi:pectate lyase
LYPRLLTTGVSPIDIRAKAPTIFPKRRDYWHACFNIKSTANIIVRNLKFDELWEWDESARAIRRQRLDFIDLGNAGLVNNI